MFSKYKKPTSGTEQAKEAMRPAAMKKPVAAAPAAATAAPKPAAPTPAPAAEKVSVMRKPMPNAPRPAEAQAADKGRKRKERLGEIKLELHRALLDNLNLAALDTATEHDLRAEIAAISTEVLQEKGVVLNREERTTLVQELYDEVKGLGPLESLLKDETVSDILVNGPHQIFVEREGKLQLSEGTRNGKQIIRVSLPKPKKPWYRPW